MDIISYQLSKKYVEQKEKEKYLVPVSIPNGFNWVDNPLREKIYTDGKGNFTLKDFDISDYEITGKTYYVDKEIGDNTNDGLTKDNPLKTIDEALGKNDVEVVMVNGGFFNRLEAFYVGVINGDLSIKAYKNTRVIVSSHEPSFNDTFTKSTGYNNVYETEINQYVGNVRNIVDTENINSFGDCQKLQEVNSINDVESNLNSYFKDEVNEKIYFRTFDDRLPTGNQLNFLLNVSNLTINGNTVYLENIEKWGSNDCIEVDLNSKLYLNNCSIKYSSSNNGLSVRSALEVISYKTICAENDHDGFNYHDYENVGTKFVEIDCIGRNNGDGSSDSDNGSTAHEAIVGIRVNGLYFGNHGANLMDVQDCLTWNLGCVVYDSVATNELSNANYSIRNNVKMWLDGCLSYGSDISHRVRDDSKLYLRNSKFDEEGNVENNGVVENY